LSATTRTDVGTVEDLHASATRLTGLDDFGGGDDYLEGLGTLLRSYAKEASLTPAGSKQTRGLLRSALVSRLLAEAAWRQYPEHADVALPRPVFVTGLPRTGTTALHRLLTADPAHQGPELWLTEVPQPRPPRETWDDHPVFAMLRSAYESLDLTGIHQMGPAQVEECWRIFCQSMTSVSFECTAYVPSYSAWLAGYDWRPAYRRHRRNLQLIGLPDQGRRWVLKNPSHLFALDALLEVYPDAVIIQTHRDPRAVLASVCGLNAHAAAGWSSVFHGAVVGRAQLSLWSRGLRSFEEARERHDPAHFIDVRYEDFVADPLGVVGAIYDRLDSSLSDSVRAAMSDAFRGTRAASRRYDLSEFGLTASEVDAAFSGTSGP
jgi:hypothetical protein